VKISLNFFLLLIIGTFLVSNSYGQILNPEPGSFMSNNSDTSKQDSSKLQKTIPTQRIDPFYSIYSEIQFAKVKYDSLEFDLSEMTNYHPLFGLDPNVQTIGEAGMPIHLRRINPNINHGFQHGLSAFEPYFYNHNSIQYYRIFTPFTKFEYIQTKIQYVHLQGFHSQNISPGWNIALKFRTINSNGFYPNQKNSLRQFGFSSRYTSKNNRYYVQGSIQSNRTKYTENGGWANDSIFDSLEGVNKSAEVNMINSNTMVSFNQIAIDQIYWIKGEKTKTSDTTYTFKPVIGLQHKVDLNRSVSNFNSRGQDLLFQKDIFLDSSQTKDSIVFITQKHQIGFVNFVHDSSKFSWFAGISTELINARYFNSEYSIDSGLLTNFSLSANQRYLSVNKKLRLYFSQDYCITGFNKSDLKLDLKGEINWFKNISSTFNILNNLVSPSMIQRLYVGNHHNWNNQFNQTNIRSFNLNNEYHSPNTLISIGFSMHNIGNHIYVSESIKPTQFEGNLGKSEIKFNLKHLYKVFGIKAQGIYQQNINKESEQFIPTPDLSIAGGIFFQKSTFKNALVLKIGADARWFSEYYAQAYDPSTRLFYLQQSRKQGNYPFVDFYIQGKVKSFDGFLKLEHANFEQFNIQFPNSYYSTLGYSLPPRRIVFGVSWKFYY